MIFSIQRLKFWKYRWMVHFLKAWKAIQSTPIFFLYFIFTQLQTYMHRLWIRVISIIPGWYCCSAWWYCLSTWVLGDGKHPDMWAPHTVTIVSEPWALLGECLWVFYAVCCRGHNQRLEFLGDTVLQLIASEYLYRHFPEHHEGHLSVSFSLYAFMSLFLHAYQYLY